MRLLRSRMLKRLVYVAFLMSVSLLMSFVWMDKTPPNNVFFDGPEIHNIDRLRDTVVKPTVSTESIRRFDCAKLFNNDPTEMSLAKAYLQLHKYNFSQERDLLDYQMMTNDCEHYRYTRGYATQTYSEEELTFPIAYNILFHQNIEQLERLLQTLYRPQNVYCIHVDKKAPEELIDTVRDITKCFKNVFVASKLEYVIYKSFTRLSADINCMRDHVDMRTEWKYLINMASSELPIMTNLQTVHMLKHFNGKNDIHEVWSTMDEDRFKKKHFTYIDIKSKSGHIISTDKFKEPPPHGLKITKGNAYNVFSRAFVEFVVTDKIAKSLLVWSMDTLTPDEHYWATLNNLYSNAFLNTPGGYTGHPDKKSFFGRYIGWNNRKQLDRCKAQHYIHNVCVFSVEDLPKIQISDQLIANKFDIDYDPVVYTCMEEWLHNKTRDNADIVNARFYKKIAANI